MTKIDEAGVLAALATVIEPDSGRDVVSLKMVSGLVVKDGNVGFRWRSTRPAAKPSNLCAKPPRRRCSPSTGCPR